MGKLIDITGEKFGMLTVLGLEGRRRGGTYWVCRCDCGNEVSRPSNPLRTGRTYSCGCVNRHKRGGDHHNWNGGRQSTRRGYSRVFNPDHPNAMSNGYVLEHVMVMSEHVGRPLLKGETVHHKNGVRDDNRIENLELWSKSHPPGQRVTDKVAWAKEILSTYESQALAWSESNWTPDPKFMRGSFHQTRSLNYQQVAA